MNRKIACLFAGTVGALAIHGPGLANDTAPDAFDAPGRIIAASTSGGPTNGRAVPASYAAAGNSANDTLTGSGGMLDNQPPVTVTDDRTVQKCTVTSINVVANDSDPEGNLPIVLLSVSAATKGQASVHNGTTVVYESTTAAGLDSLTYTVRDSLGAESNGTLNVTISGGLINCA